MDGLTLLGILALIAAIWLLTYSLCRMAALGDEDPTGDRFFMQMEAFNWPDREEA